MTIKELIAALQELPNFAEIQDYTLQTEGCCCYGSDTHIEIYECLNQDLSSRYEVKLCVYQT